MPTKVTHSRHTPGQGMAGKRAATAFIHSRPEVIATRPIGTSEQAYGGNGENGYLCRVSIGHLLFDNWG